MLEVLAESSRRADYTSQNQPGWLKHPDLILYYRKSVTGDGCALYSYWVPPFQLTNGQPEMRVLRVNHRLIERYEHGKAPWGSPALGAHVWWVRDHPRLGFPPINLLDTERETELFTLANRADAS